MQLFYHPDFLPSSSEIVFSKEESRHITKVLRKQEGDTLALTDGKGHFIEARVVSAHGKQCIASVEEVTAAKPLPYRLHMAVAPTKLNDRFEWFLEKATEIGISEITPLLCAHSERKVIKPERYEKILQSAMKQSLKGYLPRLNPMVSYSEFITTMKDFNGAKYIAHCDDGTKKTLRDSYLAGSDVMILIGPEGDFSQTEVQAATNAGCMELSLGSSRLRTETAAIVACHSIAFLNE